MLGDDAIDQIANALRRLDDRQQRTERELVAARAQIQELVKILIKRNVLVDGHLRHLDTVNERTYVASERKVRLRVFVDKYNMQHGPAVDCAARLHLCRARCCSFRVTLTEQDVEEGKVKWDLLEPYVMQREGDGYCTYLSREDGRCTNYEVRPATCREYSCIDDRRVWLDFEKMIPAPLPAQTESLDET
jgi:hypothetical protein